MKVTTDPEELSRDPIGTYLVGASFIAWVQSKTRIGMFHTAALDRADYAVLQRIFSLPTNHQLAKRYDLLHDIAAVSIFDESAFAFFEQFLRSHVDLIAARVRRLAVVRPSGLAGAAFTGMFHEWVVSRFDATLVSSRSEAYDFLSVSQEDRDVLDSLSEGEASFRLRRLRDLLVRDVRVATLSRAAASISMSVRSLQRLLAMHGTSFRNELAKARIRVAEGILLDRNDKLEAIAHELGFRSASSFSTMFAQSTGEPPSAFRSRCRTRRPST